MQYEKICITNTKFKGGKYNESGEKDNRKEMEKLILRNESNGKNKNLQSGKGIVEKGKGHNKKGNNILSIRI